MLLAVASRKLVDDWIEVFNLAGAQLERLAPAQSCRLAAVNALLEHAAEDVLTLLIHPLPVGARLLLLRRAEPVFDWPLPEGRISSYGKWPAAWRSIDAAIQACIGSGCCSARRLPARTICRTRWGCAPNCSAPSRSGPWFCRGWRWRSATDDGTP